MVLKSVKKNVQVTCSWLESLGFILNYTKSELVPAKSSKYLGFIYNSHDMLVELPQSKRQNVKSQIGKFSKQKRCKIRDFASFIGILGSCCSALTYSWVHMKDFEREKFLALKINGDDFDAIMYPSEKLKSDFQWWRDHINFSVKPISHFQPVVEIFSDASMSGWGVFCNEQRTHGYWNNNEKLNHINYLELLAAFFGLKCFGEKLSDCDILLRLDNTTAIAYINKMGGIQFPKLNELAKRIWL